MSRGRQFVESKSKLNLGIKLINGGEGKAREFPGKGSVPRTWTSGRSRRPERLFRETGFANSNSPALFFRFASARGKISRKLSIYYLPGGIFRFRQSFISEKAGFSPRKTRAEFSDLIRFSFEVILSLAFPLAKGSR